MLFYSVLRVRLSASPLDKHAWFRITLGTANLVLSTISVTTSYLASALTFLRSPYYALSCGANGTVLMVLWLLASAEDPQYLVMAACFVMFLANDLYGFFNWRRMQRRQKKCRTGY